MDLGTWADWASAIGSISAAVVAVAIASSDRIRFRKEREREAERARQTYLMYENYLGELYARFSAQVSEMIQNKSVDTAKIGTLIGHAKKIENLPDIDVENYLKFEQFYRMCSEFQIEIANGVWSNESEKVCQTYVSNSVTYLP